MKILLTNFSECPENLHFEQAFIRALSGAGRAALDIVHDFRFPYAFIERLPPLGGGVRLPCNTCAAERVSNGRYDSLVVLDFPKRKACAAQFLRLLRCGSFGRKIFVANHLNPMPGHNPTADITRKLSLMGVFDRIYILESDDRKLWEGMGGAASNILQRGYAVDCRYYCPSVPGFSASSTEKERGYVFSAGSAGRDFSALAEAVKNVGLELRVFSDGNVPDFRGCSRVTAFPLAKNLHNLREAVRGARVVVVPVADSHINGSAGNSIAFLAMACGRPIIIRRTSYMEHFIRDGISGFFYASLSSSALIRQLKRALSLGPVSARRLGRAARASVLKRASLDVFARKLAASVFGIEKDSLE